MEILAIEIIIELDLAKLVVPKATKIVIKKKKNVKKHNSNVSRRQSCMHLAKAKWLITVQGENTEGILLS